MTALPKWQELFVEQVGLIADVGFPRSVARVLAWLVVCEPKHQSAEQLQATLKLSAGSVSAAVRILVTGEIVTRITFAGDRRIYYQLHPDGWQRLLRTRLSLLTQVRHVAEDALVAANDQADERLSGMRDFYARCEAQFVQLLDELADGRARPHGQPARRPRR